nr:MAG TPA: hypothetical protein [Caudoviricetes sp.]
MYKCLQQEGKTFESPYFCQKTEEQFFTPTCGQNFSLRLFD